MDNKKEKELKEELKKNIEALKQGEKALDDAIKLLKILNK